MTILVFVEFGKNVETVDKFKVVIYTNKRRVFCGKKISKEDLIRQNVSFIHRLFNFSEEPSV
jgi:hypothetical protein